MNSTAVRRRLEQYDEGNAAAAAIVLRDPERYGKGLVLWAELVGNRFATGDPDRFPELTRAWAHYAAHQAFAVRGSIGGQDKDLGGQAWSRR